MEYPLKIELSVDQDDFIEVEMLEQELDAQILKKSTVKTFIAETVISLAAALFVVYLAKKGIILMGTVFFVFGIWIFFLVNFVYNYFWGIKREYNMAVQHLLLNKDSNSFFTPERGMVLFYEDKCEYLTDEQRRFFNYDMIKHIKIIKHLYIFVMKRSKDKGMRGFAYMVIPKRNLCGNQQRELDEICENIEKKYSLKPWMKSDIFG